MGNLPTIIEEPVPQTTANQKQVIDSDFDTPKEGTPKEEDFGTPQEEYSGSPKENFGTPHQFHNLIVKEEVLIKIFYHLQELNVLSKDLLKMQNRPPIILSKKQVEDRDKNQKEVLLTPKNPPSKSYTKDFEPLIKDFEPLIKIYTAAAANPVEYLNVQKHVIIHTDTAANSVEPVVPTTVTAANSVEPIVSTPVTATVQPTVDKTSTTKKIIEETTVASSVTFKTDAATAASSTKYDTDAATAANSKDPHANAKKESYQKNTTKPRDNDERWKKDWTKKEENDKNIPPPPPPTVYSKKDQWITRPQPPKNGWIDYSNQPKKEWIDYSKQPKSGWIDYSKQPKKEWIDYNKPKLPPKKDEKAVSTKVEQPANWGPKPGGPNVGNWGPDHPEMVRIKKELVKYKDRLKKERLRSERKTPPKRSKRNQSRSISRKKRNHSDRSPKKDSTRKRDHSVKSTKKRDHSDRPAQQKVYKKKPRKLSSSESSSSSSESYTSSEEGTTTSTESTLEMSKNSDISILNSNLTIKNINQLQPESIIYNLNKQMHSLKENANLCYQFFRDNELKSAYCDKSTNSFIIKSKTRPYTNQNISSPLWCCACRSCIWDLREFIIHIHTKKHQNKIAYQNIGLKSKEYQNANASLKNIIGKNFQDFQN